MGIFLGGRGLLSNVYPLFFSFYDKSEFNLKVHPGEPMNLWGLFTDN